MKYFSAPAAKTINGQENNKLVENNDKDFKLQYEGPAPWKVKQLKLNSS